jgi:formiminotetrahydrofolate cyclodeaminase
MVFMSVDLSVAEFLSAVRNESLPGGGSVTALAGGLASSLLGKVCRLTAGRDEFLAYEDQTRQVWRECTFLDQAFLDLMERDAEAYRRVVAAYGLPKETDDQRAARARELEAAWQGAVEKSPGVAGASSSWPANWSAGPIKPPPPTSAWPPTWPTPGSKRPRSS